MTYLNEYPVEQAVLTWLESQGYAIQYGPDIAPGELLAEPKDYDQIALGQRLWDGLARLNPVLPPEALDDAFRKIARPAGPNLEARNPAFQRQLAEVPL